MKVWKWLKVFGIGVPVFKIEGLLRDGAYGYYEDEKKFIAVDKTLKGNILTHTLVHEMFHAALDRLHCQQQMEHAFVEVVVENLTMALLENFDVKIKKV